MMKRFDYPKKEPLPARRLRPQPEQYRYVGAEAVAYTYRGTTPSNNVDRLLSRDMQTGTGWLVGWLVARADLSFGLSNCIYPGERTQNHLPSGWRGGTCFVSFACFSNSGSCSSSRSVLWPVYDMVL